MTTRTKTKTGRATPGQLWMLGLASLASFIVILDMVVVSTALTAIQRNLGSSLQDLEWTVGAYTLSFAVLLMTAASLGDRFGRRRVFAAGLVIFAVFSAACALAPTTGFLIGARIAQGAGAAAIMPAALALLNGAFPPERRGWAIGIYGSVTGLGAALGPIIGGALTAGLGWRSIFWFNVPIAIAVTVLLYLRVKETPRVAAKLDLAGLALITVGALGLVWGLVRGNTAGWGSPEIIGTLVVGAAATVVFVIWERRAAAPMLPPRLFSNRAFSAGNTAIFFLNATMTGALFLTAQFMQLVLHQDPLGAGLRLLPWGIAPFVVAPFAGALTDRFGARPVAVTGMAVQTVGTMWMLLVVGPRADYLELVAPMTVFGIGFALAIPAITRAATSEVAVADLGKASGVYSTTRQLGGAFGIAILGAAFAGFGSYANPTAFSAGFSAALGAGVVSALAGTIAALLLPGRAKSAEPVGTLRPGAADPLETSTS